MTLTSAQRKKARAMAHHLEPVVRIGRAGLSEGTIAAVSQALFDHELIKVRFYEPEDKKAMSEALAQATGSHLCGLLGHTAILYRRHPERPQFEL